MIALKGSKLLPEITEEIFRIIADESLEDCCLDDENDQSRVVLAIAFGIVSKFQISEKKR